MIEYLSGTVLKKQAHGAIINCSGVGYGVTLCSSHLLRLKPEGSPIELWITTRVREDELKLFGFETFTQRQAFELLCEVSGVGPKVALAILSTMDLAQIVESVFNKRLDLFCEVPGIGKKLAERLIFELSSKIDKLELLGQTKTNASNPRWIDVKSALMNLGYKDSQFSFLEKTVEELPEDMDLSQTLKQVLWKLSKNKLQQEMHI